MNQGTVIKLCMAACNMAACMRQRENGVASFFGRLLTVVWPVFPVLHFQLVQYLINR